MARRWRLVFEAVWRMVPPGKRAVVLSEKAFSKRDSAADYWIIEDELDDERRAASLWEKAAAECAKRGRMIFWTQRRAFRSIVAKIGRRGSPSSLPRFWERSNAQIEELLRRSGWVLARKKRFLVWPFGSGLLAAMGNRWMSPLLPWLCFVEIWVARRIAPRRDYACSVIVPARNEAGNLGELLNRLPAFGTSREVVFVEGGSTDGTWETIAAEIQKRPGENMLVLRQRGNGKGQAVRQAVDSCRGELIFILDADLSVDPEALSGLYWIMQRESADFINGNRFARPMELVAMRPLNWLGNKVFARLMSFLLGQRFSDTLCGTKVFFREDFLLDQNPVARMDPFGDYGLLIGAGLRNLRIREAPLDYRARRYGRTNIQRWRDGWLLLRILLTALVPAKFPPCNPIPRQDARCKSLPPDNS